MHACPNCGFQNADGRSTCKQCHQSMSMVAGSAPPPLQSVQTPQADQEPPPHASLPPPVIPTSTVAPKKPGLWIKIGLGLGAFVVGCCVILMVIGAFAPASPNTASAATPEIAQVIEVAPTKAIVKVVEVEPTQTPEPTATAKPTQTPSPTAKPTVKPTTVPAEEPSIVQGMGVPREKVQAAFEKLNFVFKPSSAVRGQPRVMAQRDIAIVEIIGPASDITQASVLLALSANDSDAATRGLIYWGMLITAIAPDRDIGPWVVDQMKAATEVIRKGENYTGETTLAGYNVEFTAIPLADGVMMTLQLSAE